MPVLSAVTGFNAVEPVAILMAMSAGLYVMAYRHHLRSFTLLGVMANLTASLIVAMEIRGVLVGTDNTLVFLVGAVMLITVSIVPPLLAHLIVCKY